MTNICAAQNLVGYFLTKQLESMKPERRHTTNLKDLVRMHLAFQEAFSVSCHKEKNIPQNLTRASTDTVISPGVRSRNCEEQEFSPLCLFFFFFLALAHYHLTNSRITATKPPAREQASRLHVAALTPSSIFTC